MGRVVGVRFKPAGKVYDFDACAFVLKPGDHVIVSADYGFSYGYVVTDPVPMEERESKTKLKKIYRLATEDDLRQKEKNIELEKRAHEFCLAKIGELNLKMNLFTVESNFDASKLTFFFTAEGRIDFRQLVKMLVKEFRIRIEMRQVGIRNKAKMTGGLGRCGREICCSAHMEKFEPVSIRMAKHQGLSLNPTKISGQCGRLMCCLTFENEVYQNVLNKLPKIGRTVETKKGKGKILRHNVISGRFTIAMEDGTDIELSVEDLVEQNKQKE